MSSHLHRVKRALCRHTGGGGRSTWRVEQSAGLIPQGNFKGFASNLQQRYSAQQGQACVVPAQQGRGRLGGSSWGEGSTHGSLFGNEQHGSVYHFMCHIFTEYVKY